MKALPYLSGLGKFSAPFPQHPVMKKLNFTHFLNFSMTKNLQRWNEVILCRGLSISENIGSPHSKVLHRALSKTGGAAREPGDERTHFYEH